MNIIVKSAVASALALGATAAFAFPQPNTNSSDLILIVDAFNTSGASVGVYALDTGITINTLMPGATSGTGLSTTANSNSTAFAGISKTLLATPTLSTFLSNNSANTIQWTVEGGQFAGNGTTGPQNSNTTTPGNALAIFTSQLQHAPTTAVNGKLQGFLGGLSSDLTSGGLSSLTGTETNSATQNTAANTKYGFYSASDLSSTGSSAVTLWGFTGNGVTGGNLESYILGNATLSASGTLTFAANPSGGTTVPLPAAVWLFGSGILGLLGVSRRRKAAAAV